MSKKPTYNNWYQQQIRAVTKAPMEDLPEIEDVMRQDIFHSTLDWQSKEEFAQGAREAWEVVQMIRAEKNRKEP